MNKPTNRTIDGYTETDRQTKKKHTHTHTDKQTDRQTETRIKQLGKIFFTWHSNPWVFCFSHLFSLSSFVACPIFSRLVLPSCLRAFVPSLDAVPRDAAHHRRHSHASAIPAAAQDPQKLTDQAASTLIFPFFLSVPGRGRDGVGGGGRWGGGGGGRGGGVWEEERKDMDV